MKDDYYWGMLLLLMILSLFLFVFGPILIIHWGDRARRRKRKEKGKIEKCRDQYNNLIPC